MANEYFNFYNLFLLDSLWSSKLKVWSLYLVSNLIDLHNVEIVNNGVIIIQKWKLSYKIDIQKMISDNDDENCSNQYKSKVKAPLKSAL